MMDIDDQDQSILPPLPPSDPSRLEMGGSGNTVRWLERRGVKEPVIYANVLQGYDSKPEMLQDFFAKVSIQPIMPMPVHTSPLYLMLSRVDRQHSFHDCYVSSLTLTKYLQQLLFFYTTTYAEMAKEKDEANGERIVRLAVEYDQRYWRLMDELYNELVPLYSGLDKQAPVPVDRLEAFVRRVVRYTYDYFHLMEYMVWRIIDPEEAIELGQLLTPARESIARAATPEEQQVICKSFALKGLALNENLAKAMQGQLAREWFPSLSRSPLAPGHWTNQALLQDYFWHLNTDE